MPRRRACESELSAWPFSAGLDAAQRERLLREVVLREVPAGGVVCAQGEPVSYWMGVQQGAIKVEALLPDGRDTTLATLTRGAWFGEGSVLKREDTGWPFEAVALVRSEVALMPRALFHHLLETSLQFNRFLIDLLNARLAQFIERCAHERLHGAEQHIAHCIHEFTDRRLYPEHTAALPLSQHELAKLAGVSRPMVSRALHRLEQQGIVRVAYGSIELVDPQGLRDFSDSDAAAPRTCPGSPAQGAVQV